LLTPTGEGGREISQQESLSALKAEDANCSSISSSSDDSRLMGALETAPDAAAPDFATWPDEALATAGEVKSMSAPDAAAPDRAAGLLREDWPDEAVATTGDVKSMSILSIVALARVGARGACVAEVAAEVAATPSWPR
jgi:hypothetical protein